MNDTWRKDSGTDEANDIDTQQRDSLAATQFYIAAVIIFGSAGNLLCLFTYRLSKFIRKCRLIAYTIAFTITDTILLLCLLLIWLKNIDVDWQSKPGVCEASTYLSNTSSFLSAWYVAALTVENASAMRRPHVVPIFSRSTMIKRIVFITVIGSALNAWTLALTNTVKVTTVIQGSQIPQGKSHKNGRWSPGNFYASHMFINHTGSKHLDEHASGVQVVGTMCQIAADGESLFKAFTLYQFVLGVATPLMLTIACHLFDVTKYILDLCWYGMSKKRGKRGQHCESAEKNGDLKHAEDANGNLQCSLKGFMQAGTTDLGDKKSLLDLFISAQSVDSEREQRVRAMANAPREKSAKVRPSAVKRRQRMLISPARYHAMLHKDVMERCLKREAESRPFFSAKSIVYLICTLPHFVVRLKSIVGNEAETMANAKTADEKTNFENIVNHLFFAQFALNMILYGAFMSIRTVSRVVKKRPPIRSFVN